jgi:hypothetical protein
MASSNPIIGSGNAWAAGYEGTAWTVAVLDTGVDKTHPFFATSSFGGLLFIDGDVAEIYQRLSRWRRGIDGERVGSELSTGRGRLRAWNARGGIRGG